MSETLVEDIWRDDGSVGVQCQCNFRGGKRLAEEIKMMKASGTWEHLTQHSRDILEDELRVLTSDVCTKPADPASGEGLLCTDCMNSPHHMESNMALKRLPKREVVYGASA